MKISQEEKDRNKQQMIDAATTLIAEQGFAKVSLRDISKKAGMSQASAYKYFQSKENIVFAFLNKFRNNATSNFYKSMTFMIFV
ncbi:MAG: helix-turn-helix domain-containing protein [Bdellovibrionota bacterium]